MKSDYVPNTDGDFLIWANTFTTYFQDHKLELGFTQDDAEALTTDVTDYQTRLYDLNAKRDAAHGACETKKDSRDTAEETIRGFVRRIQASPTITDEQRRALGIPVRDSMRTPTATGSMNRPVGSVDTSQRLLHKIRYWDELAVGKARPQGAAGAEVWMKVAAATEPAPTNPDDFDNLGVNSASPYVINFTGDHGGKTAHYILRWVTPTGEKGPWSEVLSATIVG